jgi:hypothetical protein
VQNLVGFFLTIADHQLPLGFSSIVVRCRDPEIDRKRKVERRKERGK